ELGEELAEAIAPREALFGLRDHAARQVGDELAMAQVPRGRGRLGERGAKHRAPAWGLVAKATPGPVLAGEQAEHLDVLDLLRLILAAPSDHVGELEPVEQLRIRGAGEPQIGALLTRFDH